MNINTFRDAVQSRKSALANDIQDDDDDEREVAPLRRPVEGEEDESKEKVRTTPLLMSHIFTTYNYYPVY